MARPLRIQFPGALYHITNRGNGRKAIFKDNTDRKEFLAILSQSILTYNVCLHSFVLMKNHWHFLAQTPLGNLSDFMRHFNITYTSYFNRRHNRVGNLYQGRYQSFLVEQDSYLSMVSQYIHLNPVKITGFKRMQINEKLQYLWKYEWSSLPGFTNQSKQLECVDYDTVLAEYSGNNPAGRKMYKKQIIENLAKGLEVKGQIVGQSILGDENFVSWVKENFLEKKKDREKPGVGKIHKYLSLKDVLKIVEKATNIKESTKSVGTNRQIVMTMLYKYAGLNNREIGELMNIDYSTVSQGRKRLLGKATKDYNLKVLLEKIESSCQR
jgi:putative transposase